ncbi:MAG: tRNA-intron lyase [Candidatus Heimdallarchaeota archaeon]|nr:MAG: tRNA-intron lyase [Candidatus Heimdallarchaeota archaeon]
MVIVAKLHDEYALINDKEGNSIYSQGWFGKHTKSGNVKLSPYETVLLLERKKIDVISENETSLPLSDVVAYFSNKIPDFLVRFLLYKDLRNRGYVVKEHSETGKYFELYERGATPNNAKHLALVVTMVEGVLFDIDDIDQIVSQAKEISKQLIFAVIDSLGDVSYYSVSELELTKIDIDG